MNGNGGVATQRDCNGTENLNVVNPLPTGNSSQMRMRVSVFLLSFFIEY